MSEMRVNPVEQSGIWLAMDTSTAALTIALLRNGELLAESNTRAERNHSMYLVPSIQKLLSSQGISMRDLNGVAAGKGPGSYTGVRIAVTVAKTFAWSLQLPLVGVSSLEALAFGAVEAAAAESVVVADSRMLEVDGGLLAADAEVSAGDVAAPTTEAKVLPAGRSWIIPLMDARRGQAYTAIYEWDGYGWSNVAEDGIRLMEPWMAELGERLRGSRSTAEGASLSGSPSLLPAVRFVGESALFSEVIRKAADGWDVPFLAEDTEMRARDVGRLALQRWERGQQEDVHAFEPNYTQLAEAEKNLLLCARERV